MDEMTDDEAMQILKDAQIGYGVIYHALSYVKWKDSIDVDYPTVELKAIINAATNAKIKELEAALEKKVCGEDCCMCLHPKDNVVCDTCEGKGGWFDDYDD